MKIPFIDSFMKLTTHSKVLAVYVWCLTSCQDFVAIDPPKNELVTETAFATNSVAQAVLRGIYAEVASLSPFSGGDGSIQLLSALCSDETLFRLSGNYQDIAQNGVLADNGTVRTCWARLYRTVYLCNSAIEGLAHSKGVSEAVKMQLTAEAKFIRALSYLYLVNLWGDVPLATATDYRINMVLPRSTPAEVYNLILEDLHGARVNLPDDYVSAGDERVRATKWAATALLSRVHLYLKNWVQAEAEATAIIQNSNLFRLVDLTEVFTKNNSEAILQLLPTTPNTDTYAGQIFLPPSPSPSSVTSFPIRDELLSAFEDGDARLTEWVRSKTVSTVNYHYPYKYKVLTISSTMPHTEYFVMLRLAEQYLIRSEARARQGKLTGENSAEADINAIRSRAGLAHTTASTQAELLNAIAQERQIELFTEGHRWFDLIRTDRATSVLAAVKPDWTDDDCRWPIPQVELNNNPMLTQNAGY